MDTKSISKKWYLSRSILFCYFLCPVFLLAGYLLGGEGEFGSYRPNWMSYLYPVMLASIATYWIIMPLSYVKVFTVSIFLHYVLFLLAFILGYAVDNRIEGMAGISGHYAPLVIAIITLIGAVVLFLLRKFIISQNVSQPYLDSAKKWCIAFIIVFVATNIMGFTFLIGKGMCGNLDDSTTRNVDSIVSTIVSRIGNYYWDKEDPDYSKWCDNVKSTLTPSEYTPTETLQSPLDNVGPCSYAFNSNLTNRKWETIPEDVILIFDAEPGWNQIGEKELVQIRLYDNKEGIYVGYKSGQKFIKKEDIPELKWE